MKLGDMPVVGVFRDASADGAPGGRTAASGNAPGLFVAGQVVKLRTRTKNANGTTTGSVRTLTILEPS